MPSELKVCSGRLGQDLPLADEGLSDDVVYGN